MKRLVAGFLAISAISLSVLASCQSAPKDVPENLSAREIIQRAQEASDAKNYAAAVFYYETAKTRFADQAPVVCACEYEIAFIQYKTGKMAAAKAGLESLLKRYDQADAAFLPQEYRILSQKVLAKVDSALEKQSGKKN
jgi:outer membrane protein assembly factor BamD (BamD/ComL family)